MDYKIEVNYLKKDELIMELKLRGMSNSEDKTVDDLRPILRPLINLEKCGVSLRSPVVKLDFEEEGPIIEKKLKELISMIPNITGENSKSKFNRVQTRIMHLLYRSDHITSTPENESLKSELVAKILAALDNLEQTFNADPNLSTSLGLNLTQVGNINQPSANRSSPISQPAQHNPTLFTNNNLTVQPSTSTGNSSSNNFSKHLPIYKWDIKFNGDSDELTVYEFLDQIKELCAARKVSENQIFDSAYELFTGKARTWFVNNKSRFNDWQSLTDLLISHYSSPDYRSRLFENILRRTQDVKESIVDYMNCMKSMFRRYGTISEEMQLDIIVRNLAPFYTSQLPEVFSLQELESECIKLETKKFRVENYKSPSQKDIEYVDPAFAFKSVRKSPKQVNEINSVVTPVKGIVCFNCRKPDHLYRNCQEPRVKHCFKCGFPGVTIKTCKQCNPNSTSRVSGNV